MSFSDVLEKIGERLEGVQGSVVIGDDGIVVERHVVDPEFDSELASVEVVGGCRDLKRAMERVEAGEVEEIALVTERSKVLIRTLSPGYYLVLLLTPESSLGRSRYELKKAAYALAPEFV